MKKVWKLVLITVVGIMFMAGSVVAADAVVGPFGKNADNGMGMSKGSTRVFIADYLKLTLDELRTERQAQKSFVEIAADRGIAADALVDAVKGFRVNELEKAVAEGKITEEQALLCIAQMETKIRANLESKPEPRQHGRLMGERQATGAETLDGAGMMHGKQHGKIR